LESRDGEQFKNWEDEGEEYWEIPPASANDVSGPG
jgi:hypothetical protein